MPDRCKKDVVGRERNELGGDLRKKTRSRRATSVTVDPVICDGRAVTLAVNVV